MKTEIFKRETLKDRMRKDLIKTLGTHHSHAEVGDFFKCHSCAEKVMAWKAKKAKMGLANPSDYLKWNKTKK